MVRKGWNVLETILLFLYLCLYTDVIKGNKCLILISYPFYIRVLLANCCKACLPLFFVINIGGVIEKR